MGEGGLDVPGRGSDTKTLKEEGASSVCGTDMKSVWLDLSQFGRDGTGQSLHLYPAASLGRGKMIGLN